MGGMHGFGPIEVEPNEPAYHAAWEARVTALVRRIMGRHFHFDEFRNAMEHLPPVTYLESSYYERWLAALEALLVERGVVGRDELQARLTGQPAASEAPAPPVLPGPTVPETRGPETRTGPPRFALGDRVVTRTIHPAGHTRLPRYARGKRGVIASVKGPYLLPDTNAHRISRDWQPVYAVRFDARELWGETGSPNTAVCLDLWESYLEPEGTGR
jgi:nitrile hydratase